MAVLHAQPGLTYSFFYSFFSSGLRTAVDQPAVDVYNPQKNKIVSGASLTPTDTIGKYQHNYYLPAGTTPGHYFGLAVGLTTNNTLFSEVNTFEVVDYQVQPAWVGLEEFREYLDLEDDDRDEDSKLRQALEAALELVEGFTNRTYGIRQYDETIEVKDTDRVKLKRFPVNSIVAITPSVKMIPRTVQNLVTETLEGSQVSFYYRLDAENGIMYLTDSAGFDTPYEEMLLGISYLAGFATVPEPVRHAVLSLAATLHNLACSEGISYLRFSDVNFAMDKKLFDGHIGDMLTPYKNNFQV